MITTRTIDDTRQAIAAARAAGRTIGLVPTMGFLHEGHLSLIRVAREHGADFVAVSVFVNPLQFAPTEDFARYPRDEERDRGLLERERVDLAFVPDVEMMVPRGAVTEVTVAGIAAPLEGERRPGHFAGVATIVLKLFEIVQPDLAVFGRKDAQQCAVIARMVRDLNVPVRLAFGETIRETDGVAMSSRNSYLTPAERAAAPALHRALRAGEEAITHGIAEVDAVELLMHKIAAETPQMQVDYLVLVDPETFRRPADFHRDLLLAGAVRMGKTRLIDNIPIARPSVT
ncbi:MAG TPA: pantoate--beta-alanine ligase [Thermoanaerobaculia bacterium]|nr:pantoate--beta-alanine ligase [Thermoanaerobaculia bacterium]